MSLGEYQGFRATIKIFLSIVGVWPSGNYGLYSRFGPYISLIAMFFTSIGMINFVRYHIKNVNLVTKGLSIMASVITGMFKISCIYFNRKEVGELHGILNERYKKLLQNPELKNLVLQGVSVYCRLIWLFALSVWLTLLGYSISPIMSVVNQFINNVHPIKYPSFFPVLYPWYIPPDGFLHKFHFVAEFISSYILACVSPGCDSLFTLYMIQVIGQLRATSYHIKNFQENDDPDAAVRTTVEDYVTALNCRDKLQSIFGPLILWLMGTNALVLVGTMFQLKQVIHTMSVGRGIQFVSFFMIKLIQTFIYGLCGSSLRAESENYKTSIYSSKWFGKKRFMTSVVIMLSQNPLTFVVCHFSILSVEIFVTVINATMSYYFLLQTLDQ